ncbi:MAG: 4-alpha-glucanotransferase [Phocaeicola sp.]
MKLIFRIYYHTTWGEKLGVTLANNHAIIELSSEDGDFWEGSVEVAGGYPNDFLTYQYLLLKEGKVIRRERGYQPHSICLNHPQSATLLIEDSWRNLPEESYLYSSAFYKEVATIHALPQAPQGESLTIRARCATIHGEQTHLALLGDQPILGNWKEKEALLMQEVSPNEWMVTISQKGLTFPISFKFVGYNAEKKEVITWEEGENREIEMIPQGSFESYIMPEKSVKLNKEQYKVAGTAIPVFSLRSEGSAGVGDFGDLKKMVDWAVKTNQKIIQILPIYDTTITHTWKDSYPYNSLSIYAFHPMYIDLRGLPKLANAETMETFEAKRIQLNELPEMDYEGVNQLKKAYLQALFLQEGKSVLASADYLKFFEENKEWLLPYGAFCYLRDLYGTADFLQWPAHTKYKKESIEAICEVGSPYYEKIAFNYYVQYLLHIQLLEAANYARQNRIILKGDIPIGISRNSVEAWVEPYYFNGDGEAGAPPDAFSTKGQNWGLPTYNWEVMKQDNYQWWQKRLKKMAEYFTAYRIDHILGFFRIWEIPTHSVHGLLGQFNPALPMSIGEIESYGIHFQKEFMTLPFINEELIQNYFGDNALFVKETFLERSHYDVYRMREEFKTQRAVERYFEGKTDAQSVNLREGIYALISNVLFVADHKDSSLYHPRISAQQDYTYSRLNNDEKEAFNNLYNDYFYKRHNQFWYNEAMEKLPILIQSNPMLVCGEDLGMVPECVPWVMEQLQILTLEIERMPKDPMHQFGEVWNYPYPSVCTISTHDMNNLRGWWEEDRQVTANYYYHRLGRHGELPQSASGQICEEVVARHLASPSLLAILAFQDWLSIDESLREKSWEKERINLPSNPQHYWRYRMPLTLEALMGEENFNQTIGDLIRSSRR